MSSENLEIVHEGWLTKSPPAKRVLKAVSVKLKWRRRWFVLRHSGELPGQYYLAYYTDKNSKKMKGRIDLDQCEQVDAGLKFEDGKSKYNNMFDIKTPKRTYYLAADTEEDMNKWVDFVCHVCGLKPFTVDENADFECLSINNLCRQFPLNIEEQDEEHSSPDSPTTSTSSSHYIPISECISGKPLPPILPRPTIEESYDLPRRLRPPPRLSESPPPSPGSESVFTDDESINGSTTCRPSVNWQTFPRLSQNSPDLPVATNRRYTKILPEGTAPPRPPKPSHLLETSTKPEKSVELPLTVDETYDFPRSHQMMQHLTQPKAQQRKHCYTNAAPGQVSGNIFTYDFVEDDGSKVEEGKTMDLESPSSLNSPSITNASTASLEHTPPAVNRQLKPGRKCSDTSAELSPSTPLANMSNNPPIVNRRLKPTQNKINQESYLEDTTSPLRSCPPPTGSRHILHVGPNIGPKSVEHLSRIHRRHSASDDRLASDKVSSYQINKISSNSRYLAEASRFNDIQYLDLEFESSDKQYPVVSRKPAKVTIKKKPCIGASKITCYPMLDGAAYNTLDFEKTTALGNSIKRTDLERRRNGQQNRVK